MSAFEVGYCSFEEYQAGEAARIHEESLCVGGLYVIMFTLGVNGKHPAAKYPSRINAIDDQQRDGFGVTLTIMNADLQSNCDSAATFSDGYWLLAHSTPITVDKVPVIKGYFKEEYYDSDGERELHEMLAQSIEPSSPVPARELARV